MTDNRLALLEEPDDLESMLASLDEVSEDEELVESYKLTERYLRWSMTDDGVTIFGAFQPGKSSLSPLSHFEEPAPLGWQCDTALAPVSASSD